jgi:hypothetical protein
LHNLCDAFGRVFEKPPFFFPNLGLKHSMDHSGPVGFDPASGKPSYGPCSVKSPKPKPLPAAGRAQPNRPHVRSSPPLIQSKHARARSPRPHRRRRRRSRRRRWWMASTTSTSGGGGARPWRTALLTLRDESLASPSPTALLALLRRVLLSPASPSLAASAAALSPHEVRAAPDRSPLAPSAAAAARLDLTRCGVLPRMCRWDRMWRSSRRPPPRRPLAAPAPPTRCAASANW